ncbi:Cilia- and flagella-associated protein 57 [Clydaea vesicula]|uniref:Cilia- and flagella-associated protein 57 n=1 Tax=Clydaea vesicula TaxID=447962 RepID=A0AAD5XZL1_9FUNG|nr:Cilia- and flagella-associated protein 57 [Clydaea vesicula]
MKASAFQPAESAAAAQPQCSNVIYPAGANIILYNTETKTQKFIPASDNCEAITAMVVSSNKRYVAVAERGGDKPTICVYDINSMRRRKTMVPNDSDCKEFIFMAFSSDGKYILTQSGSQDWTLYYWSWERTKLMASIKTTFPISQNVSSPSNQSAAANPNIASQLSNSANSNSNFGMVINQVSFNPNDNTQVCVIGNGIFKLLRYSEGVMKPLAIQKFELKNFLSHCWVGDEKIAVGTDDGKIFIFESNGELKCEISNFYGLTSQKKAVHSLIPMLKGFVAGGESGTTIMYERSDESSQMNQSAGAASTRTELFRKSKEFAVSDETSRVVNLAMPQSEDMLVCTTEKNQIFSVLLANADVKPEDIKFEIFSQPFHHGQITGMDTCIRKPLIVTCSSDRSIRVWNYAESTSEIVKYFPEEAFSVALHPSGLYILVGFSDKLRLMNLLIDDIRPFREFTVRGCRECRFSNGGQYFAAVHGNTIQIYSTWNFENLGNLKGHNGKVRSLFWSFDDSKIISSGMDGAIYDWGLKDLATASTSVPGVNGGGGSAFKREGENILKSCSYTCAVSSPDGKSIYAVGSDKSLKVLKEIVDSQIVREIESDVVLTQVVLSHSGKMMFLGSTSGKIRSMRFPLGSANLAMQVGTSESGGGGTNAFNGGGDYQEHQGHSSVITKLRVSYDDQFLFSTSEDGCLYVFKISDKDTRGAKSSKEIIYSDEILVTKSDLEEKNSLMAELKTRVEELKMENEYQIRLKDMNFSEKIKEVTEKFMQEIEALKITSNVLKTDKEKEEVRHDEEMSEEKERHTKELMELDTIHNSKLMAEYDKYQEIQLKTADLRKQWERQMKDMQIAKEKVMADLVNHFETKLKEKQSEIDKLKSEMRGQFIEIEETTRETEEDADTEIAGLKVKYERKLKDEKEVGLRLKGENGVMRKKFNTLQSEIDAQKAEINKMYLEEKKLHTVIKSLEKDISGLKKEIQERDETIQDKEKRIYDLKKKNQELEKFKFVLDYKIKELKRQIEPREQDIQGMTAQIKDMDVELDQYFKSNSKLELAITDLKIQLKAAESEVTRERERWKVLSTNVWRFKVDLIECLQYIQEPKMLKSSLKKLYQKFCKEGDKEGESYEVDVQQEYARQREYLEKTVSSLRKKVTKDQGMHRSDNMRIMQENVTLIKEINTLRKDLKNVQQKETTAENTMKYLINVNLKKEGMC